MTFYIVQDNVELYSPLENCWIVGIRAGNLRAFTALSDEDLETLFERADFIAPVEFPVYRLGERTSSTSRKPRPLDPSFGRGARYRVGDPFRPGPN
jgi:hypothetical protein